MTKPTKDMAPSRRGIIKGAGALAAGLAAPAFLRVRSAYAAYPDRTVKIVVANTRAGLPTSSVVSSRPRCSNRPARLSS